MKKLFIIFMFLLLGISGFTSQFGSSRIIKFSDHGKISFFANKEAVVTGKKAKESLEKNPDIIVFDVRKPLIFALGHIPGAVNVWHPDFTADSIENGVEGRIASKEKIGEFLSKHGVRSHTKILIYDGNASYDATKLWWVLHTYGHKDMSIIDGGLQGWKASKLPIEYGPAKDRYQTEYLFVRRDNYNYFATANDVKSILNGSRGILLDARGEANTSSNKQASNNDILSWKSAVYLVKEELSLSIKHKERMKKFKTVKELEKIYGKYKNQNIIAYSDSGIASAHTTFVLTQILGYKNVKSYTGLPTY